MILILFFIPLSSAYSSCASWISGMSDVRAFDEASVVFVGTVIEAHKPPPKSTPDFESYLEYTTFTVHFSLKGNLEDNNVTTTPNSSVGYNDFVVGGTYFVYAYPPYNEVNICTPPQIFPLFIPTLILYFPFLLIPIGIIGVFVVWRIRKRK